MADNKPMTATLELRYVPDTYTETERQEGASWPLGSGFYDLVALVDDAALPLHRFKAGAVDKVFALAKQRREDESQQSKQTTASEQQSVAQQQTPPPEPQQTPPPPEQQPPQ